MHGDVEGEKEKESRVATTQTELNRTIQLYGTAVHTIIDVAPCGWHGYCSCTTLLQTAPGRGTGLTAPTAPQARERHSAAQHPDGKLERRRVHLKPRPPRPRLVTSGKAEGDGEALPDDM